MIYDCRNTVKKILAVLYLKWKAENYSSLVREYSALAFRLSGSAVITAGGKKYYVGSNDIIYLPQNLIYDAEYSDTEMLVIHFETSVDDTAPEVYSFANTENIYTSLLKALELWQNKVPGYEAYVQSQLYYIFGQLCENETGTKMPPYFSSALSYINSNFTDSFLSIDRICKETGIGATNLRGLFKKHCQKTPIEYITSLRLDHARNLISSGASIESAAEKSGFNDSKYFARIVKKHFGCTPKELKKFGK